MLKSILKKIAYLFLYVFYLILATLVIIYLVFWLPYIHKIESRSKPSEERLDTIKNISEETVRKVGFITKERFSAFYMKDFDKADGVIRVCALGDSFTYGDEVDNGNDYPAILQQLFVERGYSNVEVINYGNSFHGLSQAYILWEEVAKPMGCDFALLGPQTLFPTRDSYFNHTDDSSPYYLHSLFHTGDNGELVRVDVDGETHKERFNDYYSFIPRWKYLRYESRVPAVARSMIPEGKEVQNPLFYSDKSADHLAWDLWSRLLGEFAAEESVQVIALIAEEYYYNYFMEHVPKKQNLVIDRYIQDGSFPHRAPNRHHSGFGNRILAERYFAQLTGQDVRSRRIALADDERFLRRGSCHGNDDKKLDTAQLVALNIQQEGDTVGYLFHASNDAQGTVLGKVDYPALHFSSLLAMAGDGEHLGAAAYLPLQKKLAGGEILYLHWGEERQAVGKVIKTADDPTLFFVRMPGFRLDYYDVPSLSASTYPQLATMDEHGYSLWLEDTLIYSGRKFQDLYILDPVEDNQYRFVGHANGYGAMMKHPTSGSLDLVWQYQNADGLSERRCPFLTYRYDAAEYQPFSRAKTIIRKSSGGMATKVVSE